MEEIVKTYFLAPARPIVNCSRRGEGGFGRGGGGKIRICFLVSPRECGSEELFRGRAAQGLARVTRVWRIAIGHQLVSIRDTTIRKPSIGAIDNR